MMNSAKSRRVLLEDVADINPRQSPSLKNSDIVSFVPMSALSAESASVEEEQDRPYSEVSKGYTSFASGDVLFAKITPCFENGKIAQAILRNRIGVGSTEFHVIRPNDGQAEGRFLHHFLRQPKIRSAGERRMTGSGGQRRVPTNFLAKLEIILPPLAEQKRIAEVLDKAEELRAKRRAALAQLDTLTQSIFLEMFGDPVTNRKGFRIFRMGDVCDVRDGTHDSPKYVSEAGYPLVTSKNLSGGFVDLSDVNLISEGDYLQINKRSKVDQGDIIMPMIGTIGSPVLVVDEPRFAIKNVALIKFSAASPLQILLRQLLSGDYFDHIVGQKNRGGTQKFVSLGDLRSFPLPLPPIALQQEFAQRVTAVEQLKATQRASLAELDTLFASLQHKAFSGEL